MCVCVCVFGWIAPVTVERLANILKSEVKHANVTFLISAATMSTCLASDVTVAWVQRLVTEKMCANKVDGFVLRRAN